MGGEFDRDYKESREAGMHAWYRRDYCSLDEAGEIINRCEDF